MVNKKKSVYKKKYMKTVGFVAFIQNVDMFSMPIPTFNIGGKSFVNTLAGAIFSIIAMMLTFSFGLLKL